MVKKTEKPTTPGPRSVYLGDVYEDICKEAERLDRSVSWLLRAAWQLALPEIKKLGPRPAGVAHKGHTPAAKATA